MDYKIDHIPKGKKRSGLKVNMASITIHNTGNPKSTARNERNYLTNPHNTSVTGYHIVIDENEAIECISTNERAWHAGDGANGPGNNTSIGIEVCESGEQNKVWDNAVNLVAKMLKERNWGVDRVTTHQRWSGKNCPRLILPRWNEFIKDIEKELLNLRGNSDVSPWALDAYKWVVENGLSDGTNPKQPITREQVWAMLYRMRGLKND